MTYPLHNSAELTSKKWTKALLPSLSITGIIVLARLIGVLQPLEWKAFDLGLRQRFAETVDNRVTIIAITEDDIQNELNYPISDADLSKIIEAVQVYEPRAIGIDIFRDTPVGEGQQALAQSFRADNVIGVTKIHGTPVQPPPGIPEERVGFADANLDSDGFIRRSLLADEDDFGDYRFSITTRMVETFLAPEGVILENGIRDPETMRFGETEIPRFQPNLGGYANTDNGGNQALINFRAGSEPFDIITYTDLMSGQFEPNQLQDRAVLVGYTAESVKDFVSSLAINSESPSLIPGIVFQAHAVSQILSAFYDDRSFIKALPNGLEYLIILGGGLLGMAIAQWRKKPTLHALAILLIISAWVALCYGLLLLSWWIPFVPVAAAFVLNAGALYPFFQAQEQMRSRLRARESIIDQTYNTIHNGPLQTLSAMLSDWEKDQPAPAAMRTELVQLNQELRNIHAAMRQNQLAIMGQGTLDPDKPLKELLYDTYRSTLERHRSFFEPITKITDFDPPISDDYLSVEQKQNIARFLEEALINVYKYAEGTTRLKIYCVSKAGENIVCVVDNGKGLENDSSQGSGGYGTKQANKLATSLFGKFKRVDVEPKGVCCELRWPAQRPLLQRWMS